MIRAVRVYIAPNCPGGRYCVAEEYPTMQTLYTGDSFDKVIEAIRMDDDDNEGAELAEILGTAHCVRSAR